MSIRPLGRLTTVCLAANVLLAAGGTMAADAERGRRLYEALECAACHGPAGRGDGPVGKSLAQVGQPPGDWADASGFALDTDKDGRTGTPRDVGDVIRRGAFVFGGAQMMGPTKGLSEEDVADLVAFVRSLAR